MIKKMLCYSLSLTITGQSLCSDSLWSRLGNWSSSLFGWASQNPGKTALILATASLSCYAYKKSCELAEQEETFHKKMESQIHQFDEIEINENVPEITKEEIDLLKNDPKLQLEIDHLLTNIFKNKKLLAGDFQYNTSQGEKNIQYLLMTAQEIPQTRKLSDDINQFINSKSRITNKLSPKDEEILKNKATKLFNVLWEARNLQPPGQSYISKNAKPKTQVHFTTIDIQKRSTNETT